MGIGWSNLTWQAIQGLGFRFDGAGITLAWRALGYVIDDGDVDLNLSGPGLPVVRGVPALPGAAGAAVR